MIVNYEYYNTIFSGNLVPEEAFNRFSIQAQQIVLINIMGKDYSNYETQVKNTICEVIEICYNQKLLKEKIKDISIGDSKIITSETVGKHSRSYGGTSIDELKKISNDDVVNKEIKDIIERNLLLTGLLERSVLSVS